MPFASNAALPSSVRDRYSARCQTVFRKAFNADIARHSDESRAFRIAHTAGRNCMESVSNKALMPVHAKALAPDELNAFFEGHVPWRILAIPFGGPIPSNVAPKGADLDGQWFSERTDLFGSYDELRQTNERLVDWHHSYAPIGGRGGDPIGRMNGAALGKAVLDEEPDEDGHWVSFWARKGEERLRLVRQLVERGTQLFGSAQPLVAGKADPATGEITEFPFVMETITTHPQNTHSVVRPKALLDDPHFAELSVSPALIGLLAELDALGAELPQSFQSGGESFRVGGDVAVKAGGVDPSVLLGPLEEQRDFWRARTTTKE